MANYVDHERAELAIVARREREMARRGICCHYSYREGTSGAVCNVCDSAFPSLLLLLADRRKKKNDFNF